MPEILLYLPNLCQANISGLLAPCGCRLAATASGNAVHNHAGNCWPRLSCNLSIAGRNRAKEYTSCHSCCIVAPCICSLPWQFIFAQLLTRPHDEGCRFLPWQSELTVVESVEDEVRAFHQLLELWQLPHSACAREVRMEVQEGPSTP